MTKRNYLNQKLVSAVTKGPATWLREHALASIQSVARCAFVAMLPTEAEC